MVARCGAKVKMCYLNPEERRFSERAEVLSHLNGKPLKSKALVRDNGRFRAWISQQNASGVDVS